jgi:hypothetical protein
MLLFTLSLLWVVSCGKQSTTTPTTSGDGGTAALVDACSLITLQEAEAAAGEDLVAPEPEDQPYLGLSTCFWNSASQTSLNYVQVSVIATDAMDAALRAQGFTAKTNFEDQKATSDRIDEISGLGDSAFWTGPVTGLHVLQGDFYLTISVGLDGDAASLAACKDIAEKALSRLP